MFTLERYHTSIAPPLLPRLCISQLHPADADTYAEPIGRLESTLQTLERSKEAVLPQNASDYSMSVATHMLSFARLGDKPLSLVAEFRTPDERISHVVGYVSLRTKKGFYHPLRDCLRVEDIGVDPLAGAQASAIGSLLVGTAVNRFDPKGVMGLDMAVPERLVARDIAANAGLSQGPRAPMGKMLYFYNESSQDALAQLQLHYPSDLKPASPVIEKGVYH